MHPGHTIREWRRAHGLSQSKLSRLVVIPQAKLSSWELGKSTPPESAVQVIREALDQLEHHIALGNVRTTKRTWSREVPGSVRPPPPPRPVVTMDSDCRILPNHSEVESRGGDNAISNPSSSPSRRPSALVEGHQVFCVKPKAISLFSGCGGMSLGFRCAGFDIVGSVELDKAAAVTYHANFPTTAHLGGDIRNISNEDVQSWVKDFGHVHILFGGPPCQGFSLAGKRDPHDHRNQLYGEFARIASVLRPEVIVLENVRLLTSMKSPDGSRVVDGILKAFNEADYKCQLQELNAQDYGIPQFRDRVFLIGVRSELADVRVTFPERTHASPAETACQGSLFGPRLRCYATFRDATADLECLESGEASTTDPLHWAVGHPPHVVAWLKDIPEGQSAHNNPDPGLRPPTGYNTTYKRLKWDEPCSTIGTTFGMISGCRNVHPTSTRSLTVREAARCQTFPDDFVWLGKWGEIRRVIGNAVPPMLAQAVAAHILRTILVPMLTHDPSAYSEVAAL